MEPRYFKKLKSISSKNITHSIGILVVITSGLIISAIISTMPVQGQSLSHDTQQVQGLGSKSSDKNSKEVTQFAITQNQSKSDPSNITTDTGKTVVPFGSNQDQAHSTPDYATISRSDLKAQFGSNQN
jgi:hypothetical protein